MNINGHLRLMRTRATSALFGLLHFALVATTCAGIVASEYYIGTDPGEGHGTPVNVTDATDLSATLATLVRPVTFSPGTYDVGLRVKDSAGRWSNPLVRRFTIFPRNFSLPNGVDPNLPGGGPTVPPSLAMPIMAAEYFLGSDPGQGNATSVAIAESTDLCATVSDAVRPLSFPPGTHQIGVRVRDEVGRWSNPLIRRFTISDANLLTATLAGIPPDETPPEPPLHQVYELSLVGILHCGSSYEVSVGGQRILLQARPSESAVVFLNRLVETIQSDPGIRNLVTAARISSGAIRITSLKSELYPDDWVSATSGLSVAFLQRGTIGELARRIEAAEYFVNAETPPGSGTPIALAELASNAAGFAERPIPISNLRSGTHTVGVRFRNAAGGWGNPVYRRFASYSLYGVPDVTAPEITLSGGSLITIPFNATYSEPGFVAVDNVDGDLTPAVVRLGDVNTALPGEYPIRYSVVDNAGNKREATRIVRVMDTDSPVFTGPLHLNYTEPPGTIDLFARLTAGDNQFGNLTHLIQMLSNNVNWFEPGTYQAAFEVRDPVGNTASIIRVVTLGEQAVFYPAFDSWITSRASLIGATTADLFPEADPDRDGINNSGEWLADTDPFDPWSKLAFDYKWTATDEQLRWDAQRRILYRIESCNDLVSWLPATDEVSVGQTCRLEWTKPRDSGDRRIFYRVTAKPRQPVLQSAP